MFSKTLSTALCLVLLNSGALMASGQPEGFDPDTYLNLHSDLAAVAHPDDDVRRTFAINHYTNSGRNEGRIFLQLPAGFVPGTYLNMHPDLAQAPAQHPNEFAQLHYFVSGRAEGRMYIPGFNVDAYLSLQLNPDLAAVHHATPAERIYWAQNHYMAHGVKEGRIFVAPAPIVAPVPAAVEAPVPAAIVAPVPAAVEAPVPAPIVAPVPAAVEAPVPARIVAPVPAAVEAPVPAADMSNLPADFNYIRYLANNNLENVGIIGRDDLAFAIQHYLNIGRAAGMSYLRPVAPAVIPVMEPNVGNIDVPPAPGAAPPPPPPPPPPAAPINLAGKPLVFAPRAANAPPVVAPAAPNPLDAVFAQIKANPMGQLTPSKVRSPSAKVLALEEAANAKNVVMNHKHFKKEAAHHEAIKKQLDDDWSTGDHEEEDVANSNVPAVDGHQVPAGAAEVTLNPSAFDGFLNRARNATPPKADKVRPQASGAVLSRLKQVREQDQPAAVPKAPAKKAVQLKKTAADRPAAPVPEATEQAVPNETSFQKAKRIAREAAAAQGNAVKSPAKSATPTKPSGAASKANSPGNNKPGEDANNSPDQATNRSNSPTSPKSED